MHFNNVFVFMSYFCPNLFGFSSLEPSFLGSLHDVFVVYMGTL